MLLAAAAVLPAWSAPSKINLSSGVFPYSEEPKKALEAQVQELLASQDLRDKTWGAYLVGKHGFTNHIPALERILEPQPFGSSLERSLMLRAALDALIRLRARPDPETLLPHFEAFPDEVLVLFSRAPKRYKAQLSALLDRSLPDVRWMAISNLLAEVRAPGFAASLLTGLRVTAVVQVYGGGGGYGAGGGGGSSLDRAPRNHMGDKTPVDYPSPSAYGLAQSHNVVRDAVVMAPGPYPVFSRRINSVPGARMVLPTTSLEISPRRDRERLRYLAALLYLPLAVLPLQASQKLTIDWLGPAPFLRDVTSFRQQVHAAHAELLGQLIQAGVLTLEEAAEIPLDLEIEVNDIRGARSEPLPRIPSR